MSLTDLSVRKLKAPEKGQKTYFDDALRGFGVRVSQGGSKTFVVLLGPERRRVTLGRYPETSLSDARQDAKEKLAEAAKRTKPGLPVVAFDKARTRFLEASEKKNKPRTYYDYHRLLSRHFTFSKNLDAITRQDIMSVVSDLADTPSEQGHALVAIRTMCNWCVKQGLLEVSPVPSISIRHASRSRVLSEQELITVYQVAREYPYPFGSIVRLLLLTGQRRGEIAALQWDWIDQDKRTITLPAFVTKNKREHMFPYGDLVAETLKVIPEQEGERLFPSRIRTGTVFNGWGKAKKEFDEKLEDVQPYTLHDLRRTFASVLAGLSTPIHVTEKLLNHVSGTLSGVAAVYNRHSYRSEMSVAINIYDAYLQRGIQKRGKAKK